MKNMKKLVALFAATVMTMSLSLSAFAAEVDTVVEGQGDATESFNLVFNVPENATDAEIDQLTMIAYLVPDTTTLETWEAYDGTQTIVAINQVDGEAGFTSVPVDIAKLEDGNAIAVAIGGTDVAAANVYKALIVYNEEEETIEFVWGDINNDGTFDGEDASVLSMYSVGGTKKFGPYTVGENITSTNIVWGDVNNDGTFDGEDASVLSMYSVGGTKKFGSYTIGETTVIKLNN